MFQALFFDIDKLFVLALAFPSSSLLGFSFSDQKDEALTEKEKGMQGLERSSSQYQKTGTETCPEGDDEAVGTGLVSFQ